MTLSLISIPLWLRQSSGMFKNQSYLGFYSQHTESTSHDEREAANPTLGLFVAENLELGPWLDISHTQSGREKRRVRLSSCTRCSRRFNSQTTSHVCTRIWVPEGQWHAH
jgi:hypothetical protein